mgnify:FL=1
MASEKGDYLEYPCVNGCGHHMQLKDEINELGDNDKITLECRTCQQEKEYSTAELKGIINYSQ